MTYEFCIHRTEEYSGTIEIEASSEEEAKTLASKEILLIESGEKDLDTWIAGDETTIDEKALVNGDIETGFNWRERTANRIFYLGRTEATGKPVQPSYRLFLRNEEGKTVWACDNVIVNSEKSVAQADAWMMEFLEAFDKYTLIED